MTKPILNDLQLADDDWRQYPLEWTGGYWKIPHRGEGGDASYPGNFVPQILERTIPRFTRKGETVADLFGGSGTSWDTGRKLERVVVGCDLRPSRPEIEQGDARTWRPAGPVQMVVLHPPYGPAIDYNEKLGAADGDLSLKPAEFLQEFRLVAENAYNMLDSGRHAILIMGDLYRKGEYVDLSGDCARAMQAAGFTYKAKIAKDFGSEIANANKNRNLWHLRALKGGFYRFQVEYVMLFEKPLKKSRK